MTKKLYEVTGTSLLSCYTGSTYEIVEGYSEDSALIKADKDVWHNYSVNEFTYLNYEKAKAKEDCTVSGEYLLNKPTLSSRIVEALEDIGCMADIEDMSRYQILEAYMDWNGGVAKAWEIRDLVQDLFSINLATL